MTTPGPNPAGWTREDRAALTEILLTTCDQMELAVDIAYRHGEKTVRIAVEFDPSVFALRLAQNVQTGLAEKRRAREADRETTWLDDVAHHQATVGGTGQ